MYLPLLLPLAALAIAGPILQERQLTAPAPSVKIKNGTVVGSSSNGIDSFKGIPFAQPPTGPLRLKAPQSITATYGTITATGTPTACPQFTMQAGPTNLPAGVVGTVLDSPLYQAATVSGEDCLTLNVQRPSTATSSSKLPVLFWIYGGGFEFGSTQGSDASNIISKSISLGQPIIYVAVNYRLGGFGFLGGSQLKKEGNTNLGLRDQRLGLKWVQENIAAFGGDPTKVTIWGESAGSISVFDHLIINNGDASYNGGQLFRGAIMDSGSVVPADDVAAPDPQNVYNTVVAAAGCSGAADTLACLRSLDYTTYLNAANSLPGIFSYRSVDLAYLPRPDNSSSFFSTSPEKVVQKGTKYKKVPIIIGDQEDEGTLFSLAQVNITTTDQLITYFASFFPHASYSDIANLVALYPDDPSAGSPFRTGPLYNTYPQYKRLAAILGDLTFTLSRRTYLGLVASKAPAWSYLATYLYGSPVGTFHASDVNEAYKSQPLPEPGTAIQTYYISFVNSLNPNSISTAAPLINWPQWTTDTKLLLNFEAASNSLMQDNFRQAAGDYIAANTSLFTV